MSKDHISDETAELIKQRARADIVNIVGRYVQLQRCGKDYDGLCPFHNDTHIGNFKVSPSRGICKCFAGCGTFDAIEFVRKMENCSYPDALRLIAKWEDVWIDNTSTSINKRIQNMEHNRNLQPILDHRDMPMVTFPLEMVKQKMATHADEPGNFVKWLRSLNWNTDERAMMEVWLELYMVGVSDTGQTKGWTIWWQIDEKKRVRTGKMMAYKPDGHRDKTCNPYLQDGELKHYTFNWIHKMLERAGWWSSETADMRQCLFGLHLIDAFPDAEVCITESEKSAVVAQCTCTPNVKLFMACGGLENLSRRMLLPLIERKRWVVLYPDKDGMEKWQSKANEIGYDRLLVTDKVDKLWKPEDGPKADIADILVRIIRQGETTVDKIERQYGINLKEPVIKIINKLDLQLT